MKTKKRFNELKKRAKACGLEMAEVFKRAKLNASTLWRWENGISAPWTSSLDRAEAVISRQEKRAEKKAA